jgi:hypothetical protein
MRNVEEKIINLLSKVDRLEEERGKKSIVIFWIGRYQK